MGVSHGLSPAQLGAASRPFPWLISLWLHLLGVGAELAPLTSTKTSYKHTGSAAPMVWAGQELPCAGTSSWQCCHATSPFPHTKAILDGDKRRSVMLSSAMGMAHAHQSTSQVSVGRDLLEVW